MSQFDRAWKILDDNEKTGKYHQIKATFADKDNGCCINGLLVLYNSGKTYNDIYADSKPNIPLIEQLFKYHVWDKFEIDWNIININDLNNMSQEQIVNEIKSLVEHAKRIPNSYLAALNNRGWTFKQLRDLLKELDV